MDSTIEAAQSSQIQDEDVNQSLGLTPSQPKATPKSAPLHKCKSPFELVVVHSDWTAFPEACEKTLTTLLAEPLATTEQTLVLFEVPNTGSTPEAAFALVGRLGLHLITVWKIVLLRSAGTKRDAPQVAACDKTPSFGASDGFVRPSTQQFWLLHKTGAPEGAALVKGRIGECQEVFSSNAQHLLDRIADYFPFDKMVVVGCAPPTHPEFSTITVDVGTLGDAEVLVTAPRSFTVKSCKKSRILSAYLKTTPMKDLKAFKADLGFMLDETVDVTSADALRAEKYPFLPELSELGEFCATNRVISRVARRIHVLQRAARVPGKKAASKRKAGQDGEAEALGDQPPAKKQGGARNGIAAPSEVTSELRAFLEANFDASEICADEQGRIARTNAVRLITRYVDAKGLQNPAAKSQFLMDDSLRALFGSTSTDPVAYFALPKLMNGLFPKKDKPVKEASGKKGRKPRKNVKAEAEEAVAEAEAEAENVAPEEAAAVEEAESLI